MKYGFLFGIVAILLTAMALVNNGWQLIYIWPALSFACVSSGYLHFGPNIYGKSRRGLLSRSNTLLLLPYLFYLWGVWHAVRVFKRESAFDQLTEKIYIGRRLMNHEFPANIEHVVDLTCEFSEPQLLRSADYHSFQILDGFVPPVNQLQSWVANTAKLTGTIYIHCAEGHGRTGLFTAALLVELGHFNSVHDALAFVKSKRPLVQLNRSQLAMLTSIAFLNWLADSSSHG